MKALTGLLAVLVLVVRPALATDAAQQLEDIRQTLLSQALDSGIKVVSAGYVDQAGQLHESAYFEAGTTVRGVRVRSYVEPEGQQPVYRPGSLPEALRPDSRCDNPRLSRYRTPLLITVRSSGVVTAFNRLPASSLQQAVEGWLSDAVAVLPPWQPLADGSRRSELSGYELLLTGIRPLNAAYELQVEMQTPANVNQEPALVSAANLLADAGHLMHRALAANPVLPLSPAAHYDHETLQFQLRLLDRSNGDPLLANSFRITLPRMRSSLRQTDLLGHMVTVLSEAGRDFIDAMASMPACRLASLRIDPSRQPADSGVALDLGSGQGVVRGDRFLLSTADLTRDASVVNPRVMEGLAIAEVVSVTADSARLAVIAGAEAATAYRFALPF